MISAKCALHIHTSSFLNAQHSCPLSKQLWDHCFSLVAAGKEAQPPDRSSQHNYLANSLPLALIDCFTMWPRALNYSTLHPFYWLWVRKKQFKWMRTASLNFQFAYRANSRTDSASLCGGVYTKTLRVRPNCKTCGSRVNELAVRILNRASFNTLGRLATWFASAELSAPHSFRQWKREREKSAFAPCNEGERCQVRQRNTPPTWNLNFWAYENVQRNFWLNFLNNHISYPINNCITY